MKVGKFYGDVHAGISQVRMLSALVPLLILVMFPA